MGSREVKGGWGMGGFQRWWLARRGVRRLRQSSGATASCSRRSHSNVPTSERGRARHERAVGAPMRASFCKHRSGWGGLRRCFEIPSGVGGAGAPSGRRAKLLSEGGTATWWKAHTPLAPPGRRGRVKSPLATRYRRAGGGGVGELCAGRGGVWEAVRHDGAHVVHLFPFCHTDVEPGGYRPCGCSLSGRMASGRCAQSDQSSPVSSRKVRRAFSAWSFFRRSPLGRSSSSVVLQGRPIAARDAIMAARASSCSSQARRR